MSNGVNEVSDEIVEERVPQNVDSEPFDKKSSGKNLSEFGEVKITAERLKNSLQDDGNVLDAKKIVLDLIGEDDISDNDLNKVLGELTEKQLKRLNMNKNLILDIIGENKINIRTLKFDGKNLSELTKEELEKLKENKSLILEIAGDVRSGDLKKLSKLTKEDLERIKENKGLILKIAGEEKIGGGDLNGLSELTKEDLEKIKENKGLILEITGEQTIGSGDLNGLSKLTKKDLEKIKENKSLILEITGEQTIRSGALNGLSKLTKEDLEKIKENKGLILEITGEQTIRNGTLNGLSELTKEDLERIKENKSLILEITGEQTIRSGALNGLNELTKEDLEEIKENKNLILDVTGEEQILSWYLNGLSGLTKEDLEKLKENKNLILEITGERKIGHIGLKELSRFTQEKLEQIKTVSYKLLIDIPVSSGRETDGMVEFCGRGYVLKGYGEDLCQIDEESIDYCNSRNIKELWMIVLVDKIMKNSRNIRDYIKTKQEYLENNKLIDDSEFKRLFGGNSKYGKGEINQKGLSYCYLYTAYEILKKMNYFDVLIKTNLKESENGDGRYVKLPMGQPDGDWIYVSKNDIDKKFDIPDKKEKEGLRKGVSINSDSPLGFKIMEIAYIKKELMNRDDCINKEFLETGDITLTGERLHKLERYDTVFSLRTLLGDNNIINGNSRVIKEDKYVDMVFDNFQKGLLVELGVKNRGNESEEVKLINRYGDISSQVLKKDIEIINKDKTISNIKSAFIQNDDNVYELIKKEECSKETLGDVINVDDEKQVIFYRRHAYSLERCYIDKNTGEKRVCIINPWHTGIKFDMSLESAKKTFDRIVSYIDFDKLFPKD